MRFFDIEGRPCRLLPFDKDLLGTNRIKIADHNIFVKNIPENHLRGELEQFFSRYGKIKSSKISVNPPEPIKHNKDGEPIVEEKKKTVDPSGYTSRGYGFVCFEEAESAAAAIKDNADQKNGYIV